MTAAVILSTAVGSDTSHTCTVDDGEWTRTSASAPASVFWLRATSATVAPRSAIATAVARPMPDDAPVTRQTDPSSFISPSSLERQQVDRDGDARHGTPVVFGMMHEPDALVHVARNLHHLGRAERD